jgi:hypothetical protein
MLATTATTEKQPTPHIMPGCENQLEMAEGMVAFAT